jgi:hypothetical protein
MYNIKFQYPSLLDMIIDEQLNFKPKSMSDKEKIESYELLVTKLNNEIKDLQSKNEILIHENKFLKDTILKLIKP